jgi:hypothetical protein
MILIIILLPSPVVLACLADARYGQAPSEKYDVKSSKLHFGRGGILKTLIVRILFPAASGHSCLL